MGVVELEEEVVKRYDLTTEEPSNEAFVDECENGEYVKYSDYRQLLLTQTLSALFDILGEGYTIEIGGLNIIKAENRIESPYIHEEQE